MESQFKSAFLADLNSRKLIKQCTDDAALDQRLGGGPVTAFVGFDATADSLHAGHLLSLLALRKLAEHGHRPIALMGGATTMIGDPSFRSSARPMLDPDRIRLNIEGITRNIVTVMGPFAERVMVMNNDNWLGGVGFLQFMRDVGSHFNVAGMLSMESVKSRIGSGLSALEFSYMMLQSADFLHLSRHENCILQMGGSDQWGNIIAGIDLARKADGRRLFGLTTPLLETSTGTKMGKSAGGTVWLSADKLSPSDFWQFWRNTDDADVERFLVMFSDLGHQTIRETCFNDVNAAKALLADLLTDLVHGATAAVEAKSKAAMLFSKGGGVEPDMVASTPDGMGLLDLIVHLRFAGSNSAARRLVAGGGVRIGGEQVTDPTITISPGPAVLLSVGRRKRALVRLAHEGGL